MFRESMRIAEANARSCGLGIATESCLETGVLQLQIPNPNKIVIPALTSTGPAIVACPQNVAVDTALV